LRFLELTMSADDRLALFGGTPFRAGGPIDRRINRPEIEEALQQAYRDGDWHRYHGKNCERLREALAAYHGVPHVELCCSGTAALEIALQGVNIKRGDEVLVSGYDFKGIVSSVMAVGATPVVVDLEIESLAPTRMVLSEKATERTKAVVVSHLHGSAAWIDSIMDWAKESGIAVIEDACQSPGAMIAGKRAGTWGDVGVLSFGGSKLLTAGRGGTLLTSDSRIAQRMKLHCERGNHAFPLSELQAAVLLPQLATLDEENRIRATAVERITLSLATEKDSWTPTNASRPHVEPAYYKLGLFPPVVGQWDDVSREAIAAALRAEGVAIDEGFRSVPDLFAKSRYRAVGDLHASLFCGKRMLVLHHPVLSSGREELDLVVQALKKVDAAIRRGELERYPSP
jgi:perosamine synthetase